MPLEGSIISNYSVLHELWYWSLDNCTVIEMKAQICGVEVRMQQFELFLAQSAPAYWQFEYVSAKKVAFCSWRSQALVAMTIRTLKNMRTDDTFALFWEDVTTLAEHTLVNAPGLPRRRRLHEHDVKMETPLLDSMKHMQDSRYRHVYIEAFDKLTISITDCFDQHDITST